MTCLISVTRVTKKGHGNFYESLFWQSLLILHNLYKNFSNLELIVGYDLQINNIKVEKQWTGKMLGAYMLRYICVTLALHYVPSNSLAQIDGF